MLLGTLGASLLGNLLTGWRTIATSHRRGINKKGKGIIRTGEEIVRAGYENKRKSQENSKMGFKCRLIL